MMSETTVAQFYKSSPPPRDHIAELRNASNQPAIPQKPSYGLDSPMGLLASSVMAPLYLYSSLKGKFDLWDDLLSAVIDEEWAAPTLDVGCGRGMVLMNLAERKKAMTTDGGKFIQTAFGIDLFNTADQTGNSPEATYVNAASLQVVDQTVLLSASFTSLPFADSIFSVVTASLSIHNASQDDRVKAVAEICRVCRPGGLVLIVDLMGYVGDYEIALKSQGWRDVHRGMGGMKVMFGAWPCQIIRARKPSN